MRNFKYNVFGLVLSAGVLLMSVIFLSLNPSIVGDAYAAALGWRVAIAAGPGPGPYRGSVQVYDENNMASDSDKGLATQQSIKAYADSLVLTAVDGYTLTGPMTTSGGTASITMSKGTNTTINGIFTLRDGATIMVGATWQIVLPGTTSAFVLSTLVTNDVDVANSIWLVSDGIVFEGTDDAFEGTLTLNDPQVDVQWTLPGSTVQLIGVANVSSVQDSHTLADGATVVAAYTVVDDSFPVGGSIRVTCAGSKTGTTGAFEVQLWIDGTERGALQTIATVAGDWVANWILINKDLDTQGLAGTLLLDNDTEVISVFKTGDYIDTESADWLLEVFVESTDGGDAVIHEFCVFDRSG